MLQLEKGNTWCLFFVIDISEEEEHVITLFEEEAFIPEPVEVLHRVSGHWLESSVQLPFEFLNEVDQGWKDRGVISHVNVV